eukprot:TRINITY_DN6269_c0_g3_i1.p1 TRINITY_DN6269_c0_g3~~TRINITY_DN6269_c0_g3_i1.p1  ORF type:complete len:227 (+),score=41.18 TRINITY_DN6269_c0_g3_i1:84-764(+)
MMEEAARASRYLGLRTALNFVAAEYPDLALIVHRVKRFKQDAQERLWTYHSQFDDVKDVVLTFDFGKTGEPPDANSAKIGNIAFVIMARSEGVARVLAHGNEHWMGEFYLRIDKFIPKNVLETKVEQASGYSSCPPDSSNHHDDTTWLSWEEARRTSLDGSFLDSREGKTFDGSGGEHADALAAIGLSFQHRPQPGGGDTTSLSAIIARYALPEPASLPHLEGEKE